MKINGKLLVMKCDCCHNTDYWSKRANGKAKCHWCENVQSLPTEQPITDSKYCHIGLSLNDVLCGKIVDFCIDEESLKMKGIQSELELCSDCFKIMRKEELRDD